MKYGVNLIWLNDTHLSSKDATPYSNASSKMTPTMKMQLIKDTRETRKGTNVIQMHDPDVASKNLDL